MAFDIRRRNQCHQTEATMIIKYYASRVVSFDDDVVVFLQHGLAVCGAAMLFRLVGSDIPVDRNAPAHAQMDHQRFIAVEVDEQVLGSPPKSLNAPVVEPLAKPWWERNAQVAASRLRASDDMALQNRRKSPPDSLDFGKLGHVDNQDWRRTYVTDLLSTYTKTEAAQAILR